MALLDHDLNGVRGHVLKQLGTMEREKANGKNIRDKETMLMLMCKVVDVAVQSLEGEALRLLLEMMSNDPADGPQRAKDDPGVEKFLDYFYKFCMDILFKFFQDIPEFKDYIDATFPLSREKTNLFLWLCDLISNFTQEHSFRSHFFHLRLAAFRFFRTCLRLKNGNILKHLIKHDIFTPILDLTTRESRRDNLVSLICLEYFDFMRRENIKELIQRCMTRHGDSIRTLAESPLVGPRFKDFISRWEMNIELPPVEKADRTAPSTPQRCGQGKLPDTLEED
ncbi:hypothetical protein C8Q76DRAFT_803880 [Earliella scabrosa]|nr:hypothetical protein C8Q76DRAFT_803880 [Earliella scabrosa]